MKNHRPVSGDGSAPVVWNVDLKSLFLTPGKKARTTAVHFYSHARAAYKEPSDPRVSLVSSRILTICAPVYIWFHLIPANSTYFHLFPFISSYFEAGKSAKSCPLNHLNWNRPFKSSKHKKTFLTSVATGRKNAEMFQVQPETFADLSTTYKEFG
jgi:hypothetical protein